MSEPTVVLNAEASRYEIHVDGDVAGFTQYRPGPSDGVLEFFHTEISDAYSGQGLAGKLARGAMDAVRAAGQKVLPTCPYLKGWFEQHPDDADLIA